MDDNKFGYYVTSAPLALDGRIIIGVSGAEAGIRGFLDAYDPKTGKRVWRTHTIPAPGEPGHETWSGDSWKTGGGSAWLTGSYDPALNLVYWGTGNPGPDWNGDLRPGDNLYTCSLIALNPTDGKIKWHFQFTPHDIHDWDANEIPVLFDADCQRTPAQAGGDGQSQRVLLRARSRDRRIPVSDALREANVGGAHRRERPAGSPRRHGADGRRDARLSKHSGRFELAEPVVQPADEIVLPGDPRDGDLLLQGRT